MATYEYKVRPTDVDFTGAQSMLSLCDSILLSAGEDADAGGFGVRNLDEHNATWVLSRFAVERDRAPVSGEHFKITTWVQSLDRIFTTRHHMVFDARDHLMARATTLWSIIDLASRKPVPLEWLENCAVEPHDIPGMNRPLRLRPLPSYECEERRTVRYSDIDFNGHTNTVRYIGWMLDMTAPERFRSHTIKRLDANFIKESVLGQSLTLKLDRCRDTDSFIVMGATPVMLASMEWR